MAMQKTFGIAALLFSAALFAKDPGPKQVRIETKFVEVGPGVISADFGLNFGHVYANEPGGTAR